MRLAAILLAIATLISTAHAQPAPTADTVKIDNGPLAGTPMPGFNGKTCTIGDPYVLRLHDDATLAVYGRLDCDGPTNIGGGKSFCFLDEDFHCTSRFAADPGVFAVDENGVSHNGQSYPWANKQQALAMFPAIKKQIAFVCSTALYLEAVAREHKQTLKNDSPGHHLEDCQAMLHRLCGTRKNGKVLTESGNNITALCP